MIKKKFTVREQNKEHDRITTLYQIYGVNQIINHIMIKYNILC